MSLADFAPDNEVLVHLCQGIISFWKEAICPTAWANKQK